MYNIWYGVASISNFLSLSRSFYLILSASFTLSVRMCLPPSLLTADWQRYHQWSWHCRSLDWCWFTRSVICVSIFVYVCLNVSVCICVCLCVSFCICLRVCLCLSVSVCVCVSVCVYVLCFVCVSLDWCWYARPLTCVSINRWIDRSVNTYGVATISRWLRLVGSLKS